MGHLAVEWATSHAPVASTYERLILVILAERANNDGSCAYRSKTTLAHSALCDTKTIQRHLSNLRARGLLQVGDQSRAQYIPKNRRPVVYDIQIPADWYSAAQLEQLNEERAKDGLEPITDATRPPLQPAPSRSERVDKGKPRKKTGKTTATSDNAQGGLQDPPTSESGGSSSPAQGGLQVPPRGVSETPNSVRSNSVRITPSVRRGETDETDGNDESEASPEEHTDRILSSDTVRRDARRLGVRTSQQQRIRTAVTALVTSTADLEAVERFVRAKFKEARTVKYVIDGLTKHAADVDSFAAPAARPRPTDITPVTPTPATDDARESAMADIKSILGHFPRQVG